MVKHYKDTESMTYYKVNSGQKFRLLKDSNHHKFLGADVVSGRRLKGGKVKYELRVQIRELRVQIHELRVPIYELRVPIHELRVRIQELGVQIHELED